MYPVYKSCYPLDKRCYDEFALSEDILMENASLGMANYIKGEFDRGSSILIVAGVGNNGADGIVLSRLLFKYCDVRLYVPFALKSDMAKMQLERVRKIGIEVVDELEDVDIIVDAIFGAGLSRELDSDTQKLLERLNRLDGFKISCDIPTGISVDGNPSPVAFVADITITMGALKESLYSDKAKDFVGEIVCVDLGVAREVYEVASDTHLLDMTDMKLPFRDKQMTHKGSFGHLAVVSGEKEGASLLSAMASMRFGVGLSSIVGRPKSSLPYTIMQSDKLPNNTTAIAFGMGFGKDFTLCIVDDILKDRSPIVLDADIFHDDIIVKFLEQTDRGMILTPHPKEFVSLWHKTMKSELTIEQLQSDRFGKIRDFAKVYPHITLLLKGANMLISQGGKVFINPHGSAKLSKGGSGDVLSGLISALLAQGYTPLESAISGSLALAKTAKLYNGTSYSMIATDLIDNLSLQVGCGQ